MAGMAHAARHKTVNATTNNFPRFIHASFVVQTVVDLDGFLVKTFTYSSQNGSMHAKRFARSPSNTRDTLYATMINFRVSKESRTVKPGPDFVLERMRIDTQGRKKDNRPQGCFSA
jgi:hypothetical protein